MSRTFPIIMSPYRYTIVKEGANYYSMKNDGTIFTSGSVFDTVLQNTINQCMGTELGGEIYLPGKGQADPYTFTTTTTGDKITIGTGTGVIKNIHIVCGTDAWFKIPNNFTGRFCVFLDGCDHCTWTGGYLYQSTVNEGWIAFEMYSNAGFAGSGIPFCTIENVEIRNAAIGIKLTSDGTSGAWVNGCYFHNILIKYCNMGILFNMTAAYSAGVNGMNRNYFDNVIIEHGLRANAFYGIKDVVGRDNMFMHCKVWDIVQSPGSYHTCTITADAENTIILGGIMRQVGWPADNLSSTTVVYDMWGGGAFYMGVPRMNDNYEDIKVITIPSDPASGYLRLYSKAADTNNDALFIKRKINGLITETRIPRIGSLPSQSGRKFGCWQGSAAPSANVDCIGILSSCTAVAGHTEAAVVDSTIGRGRKFTTTTTITTNAGWRNTSTLLQRSFNPVYRALFRLGTTTLQRLYLGFHTSGVDLTGDDPLNAQAGVMLGMRSTDTNFQILHNDTSGATVFESTGVAIDTNVHKIEIIADEANTRFGWTLDGSAISYTNLSTEIPSSTTNLLTQNEIQTNESGVAKNFDLALVELEMDAKW